jgi:hypothetical protein
MIQTPQKYNEWTVRKMFFAYHENPDQGSILSEHVTLSSAKKVMDANSYIYNEEFAFTVIPSQCGIEEPPELLGLPQSKSWNDELSDEEFSE